MSSSMALQLRPKKSIPIYPTSFIHFFSSSSSSSPPDPQNPNESTTTKPEQEQEQEPEQPKSSFSSYFSDVKSSLKQPNQFQNQRLGSQSPRRSPSFIPENPPSRVASIQEIQKNLSEFRRRSSAPDTSAHSPNSQPILFQDLYKRNQNVIDKPHPLNANVNPNNSSHIGGGTGKFTFDAIRESLKQFTPTGANVNRRTGDSMSVSMFKDNLNRSQDNLNAKSWPTRVIGGSDATLPIFDKERKDGDSFLPGELVKMYSYDELGAKLKSLRPEKKAGEGESCFSLNEMNERLIKLREMEEKQNVVAAGVPFKVLRDSLRTISTSNEEKLKKATIQRLDIFTNLGKTPSFMLSPPKEDLVEKYFHPDNMSSAEKMKIELEKVREEFKISESDCGSTRVQVAQLTTKILHLSAVLHKKDKHSRKGLQDMVEKRKKLLKYLRRTDWESYSFFLEKFGLRDNICGERS